VCFTYAEESIFPGKQDPTSEADGRSKSWILLKGKVYENHLVESSEHNMVQIENERMRIEHLEEACMDMVEDARQSNHAKKTDIPETFISRLDQMAKDLRCIDTAISTRLSTLQNLRFGSVPTETPKETPPSQLKNPTPKKQAPKKRKRS
jgi:hypothetical protein